MDRFNRICIIGTSASGKSTLARKLAAILCCDHIELDALFHEPGWKEPEAEAFRCRVEERVQSDRWVVDGNYIGRIEEITLGRADLIIWLDYSFPVIFSRVLRRTFFRILHREELWGGNRESIRMAFSRQSILWWVISTYRKRRREFPLMLSARYGNIAQLRFRSPRDTVRWLQGLEHHT